MNTCFFGFEGMHLWRENATRPKSLRWRTGSIVVLCVVTLHVLALGALWRLPHAADIHKSLGAPLEMVLSPADNTPINTPPAPSPTRSASPLPSPLPSATSTSVSTSSTSHRAKPAATSSVFTDTATHPAVMPATPATHAASSQANTPAIRLPSQDVDGLRNPQPSYPRLSRRLNEQGQVVIRVFVAVDGSAQQGEVKTSSGYDRLDQEALRTVLRWRFVPGQRLGHPEAMWFNVPVNFVLD